MTRTFLVLTAGLAALGGAAYSELAWGQTALQDRFMTEHALQDAQRQMSASQTEASNAQTRADTAVRLRSLETQRPELSLRPAPVEPLPARDTDLTASTLQLERLTQQALDESNARMRAIRPASEPKQR